MAFWSSEKLKQRIPSESLISGYNELAVKHGAYELCVGPQLMITSEEVKRVLEPGQSVAIPAGQFALLLTEECVTIPHDTIGFISIRASVKFQGLVNVSGFHVDPGFSGRLKFSVYNAGGRNIILTRGERIFMIWFSDLDRATSNVYDGERLGQNEITSADQNRMQGEVASPVELKKKIDELRTEYNGRLVSVEHRQTVMQWLVGTLLFFILTLVAGMTLKPALEFFLGRNSNAVERQTEPEKAARESNREPTESTDEKSQAESVGRNAASGR